MSRGKKLNRTERPAVWLTLGAVAYGGVSEGSWAAIPLALLAGCLYEMFVGWAVCAVPASKRAVPGPLPGAATCLLAARAPAAEAGRRLVLPHRVAPSARPVPEGLGPR